MRHFGTGENIVLHLQFFGQKADPLSAEITQTTRDGVENYPPCALLYHAPADTFGPLSLSHSLCLTRHGPIMYMYSVLMNILIVDLSAHACWHGPVLSSIACTLASILHAMQFSPSFCCTLSMSLSSHLLFSFFLSTCMCSLAHVNAWVFMGKCMSYELLVCLCINSCVRSLHIHFCVCRGVFGRMCNVWMALIKFMRIYKLAQILPLVAGCLCIWLWLHRCLSAMSFLFDETIHS